MADIQAAGAVVTRPGGQVLLVHRPSYDDWSFPKGKLDPGEHPVAAAVREVAEETGLRIRLGPPLASQAYDVGQRSKAVHYWTGRVAGDDDVSRYRPNKEIDRVAWVPLDEARARLSYPHDRDTLEEAAERPRKTRVLLVVRHGKARARGDWDTDDRLRPLQSLGHTQAAGLVPLLQAYDVTRAVSSSSTRCVQTLRPWAKATGRPLASTDELSEEDATPAGVAAIVADLLGSRAALCGHRPVLPDVFDALGLEAVGLATGEVVVVHHRKGRVVAHERHRP